MKLLLLVLLFSAVTVQPVFAETMRLKQWIAPPECVIEGNILTPDECDELLNPTPPPPTTPPIESPGIDKAATQRSVSPRWQISSLFFSFTPSHVSSVGESGVRIVDRSETRSTQSEYFLTNLVVLSLILIGAGLVVFTGRRAAANLSKEDKFDKMYRRVSSFWTRKAK